MDIPTYELSKNYEFLIRDPSEAFKDEIWTISEALCLYSLIQNASGTKEYSSTFRMLYEKVVSGLEHKELIPINRINKGENPLLSAIDEVHTYWMETRYHVKLNKLSGKDGFIKIRSSVLKKYVDRKDMVSFFEDLGYELPRLHHVTLSKIILMTQKLTDALEKKKNSKRGAIGGEARWEFRDPFADCATEFMLVQIKKGCKCRHDILVKNTLENALYQEIPLKSHNKKGIGLKNVITERAKELLPANRIFGSDEYDKTIECPLSNHWGISHKKSKKTESKPAY